MVFAGLGPLVIGWTACTGPYHLALPFDSLHSAIRPNALVRCVNSRSVISFKCAMRRFSWDGHAMSGGRGVSCSLGRADEWMVIRVMDILPPASIVSYLCN